MSQTIPVFCTIAGRVDGDNGRIVCSEMLSALEVAHPGQPFVLTDATDARPSLEIRILLATDNNLSLVLGLTGAEGRKLETENFSVSAMDRKLTPQSRNSLYHRAIAEIPLAG